MVKKRSSRAETASMLRRKLMYSVLVLMACTPLLLPPRNMKARFRLLGLLQASAPLPLGQPTGAGEQAGIPYGFWSQPVGGSAISGFNGAVLHESSPAKVVPALRAARAAGVRVFLRLVGGRHNYQDPTTGCFSPELWQRNLARHAQLDLKPFVDDGTLLGNMMLDDVTNKSYWCGAAIPYSDIEAVARYSKQLFPYLPTAIRADMHFLAGNRNWTYLDIGWASYSSRKGDIAKYMEFQTSTAKALGLGLAAGLDVSDGGDGTSGIVSHYNSRHFAMSAKEIATYGTTILDSPHVCGFFMWTWTPQYLARPDISRALDELRRRAAEHPRISCAARNST